MPYMHVSYRTTCDKIVSDSVFHYSSLYCALGQTGFSDGFPFLLASQSSLVALNRKLSSPITMERFRPNIVVDGCKPFDEDRWESIRFHLQNQCCPTVEENSTGSFDYIDMTVVKPCARCMIPNVDPAKGEMETGKPISAALKLIRSGEIIGFNVPKWKKEVRNRRGTYRIYIEDEKVEGSGSE